MANLRNKSACEKIKVRIQQSAQLASGGSPLVNRNDNIKNKSAYFYKVIKNMDTKERIKQKKINEHELPLEEIFYNQFIDDPDWDKHLAEKTLLGWIELIENPKLHKAVKSLPVEDQIFISYIVKECRTQKELAQKYNVDQSNICKKLSKILRIIKRNLF